MFNTKEELAALLNGREYGSEITKDEEALAKKLGLVVVTGYSDDNAEFYGAFREEAGCFGGKEILIDAKGEIQEWEYVRDDLKESEVPEYFARKAKAVKIGVKEDADGYTFIFSTALPHATFDIMEDGEKYCRGIVFNLPA